MSSVMSGHPVSEDRPPVPACVGVVGAGTMGAGIAQLAMQAGARTLLHDPIPDALRAGAEKIESMLGRLAEKGKISAVHFVRFPSLRMPAGNSSGWTWRSWWPIRTSVPG